MGYYTIRLSPAIQDMTTIVTEFGKFRYNLPPMGICASGDIFQAKVDEILGYIEGVKTYIGAILLLGKDSFEKHIEQLRIVFVGLRAAGLVYVEITGIYRKLDYRKQGTYRITEFFTNGTVRVQRGKSMK